MKKKLIILAILFLIPVVSAATSSFHIDYSKLSFVTNSKKEQLLSQFQKKYQLTYSISSKDSELEETIKELTKKTTYLLFGEFNQKEESSEDYYKRKKDWYQLRYDPEIPKDANSNKLDMESQEYQDDLVSGLAIAQVFNQVTELGIIYHSYGDIHVSIGQDMILSTIVLPQVIVKVQSSDNPMEYQYEETDYLMHYFYKKKDTEWKLYYVFGENVSDTNSYFYEIEEQESTMMSIIPSYSSELSTIYHFNQIESISSNDLNQIYEKNQNNLVYLTSYYNNQIISSGNGLFIADGLIVTTWSFLEKSLRDAQTITVEGNHTTYEIEGIVTGNPDSDLVVIKLKEQNHSYVILADNSTIQKENPAIMISSKLGVNSSIQTGIVLSNEDYLQTSIPFSNIDEGSPIFNQQGQVIGIATSKSTNSSISYAINSSGLNEIQNKFLGISFDQIKTISFQELKEKYYYIKYNDEMVKNNIPTSKWKEFSKIGKVEKTISMPLIKASYKDNIVSLRYQNPISQIVDGMLLVEDFKTQLIKDGYQEIMKDDKKSIYQNKKYQVILMEEFDYLIVLMVKL